MKKLKVLIVTADYPPPMGGIQVFTYALEQELLKAGHDVKVLNFDGRNLNTYHYFKVRDLFYTAATKNSYFPLSKILNPRNLLKISGGYRDFVYKNMIYRVAQQSIKDFKPDLVHVMKNELYSAVYAIHVPYIVSCHSSGIDIFDAEHIKYSLTHATKVHCVSNFTKGLVQSLVQRKDTDIKVIYNFIDLEKYKITSKRKENRIITVSRMTKKKNIDSLIKAFSFLPSEIKDTYKYYIVGKGPEEENLKALVKSLDLHNVVFTGEITNEKEKITLLSESKIFLLCSMEDETFGIVFIEAEALGLPVICYAIGGVPEATGKGGLYVKNGTDAKEIAEKIELLINDTDTYNHLLAEIKKRIPEFDKKIWFKKILAMYEEVLK